MLAFLSAFVEKLLLSGGLKVSELQSNQYHSLLTGVVAKFFLNGFSGSHEP